MMIDCIDFHFLWLMVLSVLFSVQISAGGTPFLWMYDLWGAGYVFSIYSSLE